MTRPIQTFMLLLFCALTAPYGAYSQQSFIKSFDIGLDETTISSCITYDGGYILLIQPTLATDSIILVKLGNTGQQQWCKVLLSPDGDILYPMKIIATHDSAFMVLSRL